MFLPRFFHPTSLKGHHIDGSCAGKDGQACVWEAGTGKLLRTYISNSGMNWGCLTHDNRLLACSGNRGLKSWDVQSSSSNQLLPGRMLACARIQAWKSSASMTPQGIVCIRSTAIPHLVVWTTWQKQSATAPSMN